MMFISFFTPAAGYGSVSVGKLSERIKARSIEHFACIPVVLTL